MKSIDGLTMAEISYDLDHFFGVVSVNKDTVMLENGHIITVNQKGYELSTEFETYTFTDIMELTQFLEQSTLKGIK